MFQTTNQCSFDTWMSWRKPLKMTNTPGKSIPQSWIWKISQIISNSRNWWLVHRFRGFYMPYYITIVEPSGTIWISQYYMLVFEERTMDRVIFSFFFFFLLGLVDSAWGKMPRGEMMQINRWPMQMAMRVSSGDAKERKAVPTWDFQNKPASNLSHQKYPSHLNYTSWLIKFPTMAKHNPQSRR